MSDDAREKRPSAGGKTRREPRVSAIRGPGGRLRFFVVNARTTAVETLAALRTAQREHREARDGEHAARLRRLLRAEAQVAKAKRAEAARDISRDKARISGWRLDLGGN